MKYQEIEGNLITLALEGKFDVIAHGCNCFCVMGAGIAPQMAKAFNCNLYGLEADQHIGDINKLGQIQYSGFILKNNTANATNKFNPVLFVVNCYTQYNFGNNHKEGITKPLDYEALTLCLRKINHIFKGKHVGLPLIGCGLAGGIWDQKALTEAQYEDYLETPSDFDFVKTIIQTELKDMQVTIVHFEKQKKELI